MPMFRQSMTLLEGPLARAMKRPNFPRILSVDPDLSVPGSFCLHLPELGCARSDSSLLEALGADVEAAGDKLGVHRSGKHLQVWGEHLKSSPNFTGLVRRLLNVFGLTLVDCWVNMYRNGGDMKSWHHDNYQDRTPRPTVTIGLSLGSERDLAFQDKDTGKELRVMQGNGDVFAFDEPFNRRFKHSVPPSTCSSALRLSVILWACEEASVPRMVRANPGAPKIEVTWADWDISAKSQEVLCTSPAAPTNQVSYIDAKDGVQQLLNLASADGTSQDEVLKSHAWRGGCGYSTYSAYSGSGSAMQSLRNKDGSDRGPVRSYGGSSPGQIGSFGGDASGFCVGPGNDVKGCRTDLDSDFAPGGCLYRQSSSSAASAGRGQAIAAKSFYGSSWRQSTAVATEESSLRPSDHGSPAPMSFYASAHRRVVEEDFEAAAETGGEVGSRAAEMHLINASESATSREIGADAGKSDLASTALTLQGAQQVLAILRGHKLIENRSWGIPSGWYAAHSGSQLISDERAERIREVWPDAPPEASLPHGAILGLFYITEQRSVGQCRQGYVWARGPICHLISKAIEFSRPMRCGGNKGLWPLSPQQQAEIRQQLPEATLRQFDLATVRV